MSLVARGILKPTGCMWKQAWCCHNLMEKPFLSSSSKKTSSNASLPRAIQVNGFGRTYRMVLPNRSGFPERSPAEKKKVIFCACKVFPKPSMDNKENMAASITRLLKEGPYAVDFPKEEKEGKRHSHLLTQPTRSVKKDVPEGSSLSTLSRSCPHAASISCPFLDAKSPSPN